MRIIGALIAAAAVVAAPAKADCWTPTEVSAARVRDFDTMLMVSALRCRFGGSDLLPAYNAFVARDRAALSAANDVLRQRFTQEAGPARMMAAYDTYVTKVANRYGAGTEGLSCDSIASIAAAALAEAPTVEALDALAIRAAVDPQLTGPACQSPATNAVATAAAKPVLIASITP